MGVGGGGGARGAERRGPEPRTFHRPRGRARLTPDEMVGLRRGFCCELDDWCIVEGTRQEELEENEMETGNGIVSLDTNREEKQTITRNASLRLRSLSG